MKRLCILPTAFMLWGAFGSPASLAAADPTDQDASVEVGQMAPEFRGLTTDNTPISLSSLKGKVVVLNFFTDW
jgi:hypothetical protein